MTAARITCNACRAPLASMTAPCRCRAVAAPRPARSAVAEVERPRSHWAATPTTCTRGHRHQSKVEARVCPVVATEAEAAKATLYRNVRLPLWALAPTDAGIPMYCNVDFVFVSGGRIVRIVDAKRGRRSRDWARGRKAVEATYGVAVEELS